MRVLITSDWHLGKKQAGRTVDGRNARELDIERAVERAVEEAVRFQPDLILIGGDTFDSPAPRFRAVRAWQRAVHRLTYETNAYVVVVLGNHEAGRTQEVLSPVYVVEDVPRVHIVAEPKQLRLEIHRKIVSIAAFPFSALTADTAYQLAPDPTADLNVLLMHAAVRSSAAPGLLPAFYSGDNAIDIAREASNWDLIALGDFHSYTNLVPGHPCCVYPGSLERVASNLWAEAGEAKGVVTFDSKTRELRFVEIPTRPVFDYDLHSIFPPAESNAQSLNDLLKQMLASEDLRDAIVRLTAPCERSERDAIDWKAIRELKQRCMSFQLNVQWLDAESIELTYQDRRSRTLQQDAEHFFANEPAEVRACAFRHLGFDLKVAA